MTRRSLVLIPALLTAMTVHAPTPADAHTGACVTSFAVMTLSAPFGHALSTSATANYVVTHLIAECAPTMNPPSTMGTITGTCGFASGTGTLNHHPFAFTIQGDVMVLTGDVTGAAHWTEDVTDFGRCEQASATRFLINGAWAGL